MPKKTVIIDSDFHTLADDHEALLMVAGHYKAGDIELLGLTTVTGNTWARTGADHAREAVKRAGLSAVPIAEGAGQPLLHRQSDFAHRSRMYGAAFGGAWGNADLLEKQPSPRPEAMNGGRHAVFFLIDQIRKSEAPVSLLSIGPLTNIALALRIAPDIRDNIASIVCMGGAFYVPGNVTPSAEFNWWFDPEAAAIVLEEDLDLLIVPLDATDEVVLDFDRYRSWSQEYGDHDFFNRFHRPKFDSVFAKDAEFSLPVWDALAAACLLDESIVTRQCPFWVSVDCSEGPSYGRVVAYSDAGEFNLNTPKRQRANVVLETNSDRFWALYESLLFTNNAGGA